MSATVFSWVLKNSDEQLGARLVLLVLADHAGGDGADAFPSVDTIMREARLSRRTVQNALRDLEARGGIEPNGKGPRGTTNYTVLMGGADIAPGADNDAEGRNLRHGGGAEIAPEPTTEPITEPSNADAQTALMPDPVTELWSHWNVKRGREEKLTAQHKSVMKNALKVRPLDNCKRAIDGLFADPWWRDNVSPLELRHALKGNPTKGEADTDRIDKMCAKAEEFDGTVPHNERESWYRSLDAHAKENLRVELERARELTSDDEDERALARGAINRLRAMGVEIVVGEDGRPREWTYKRPEAA